VDLYILRHGKAEEAGSGMQDHDRRLTKKGRAEIGDAACWMAAKGIRFDLIAASPLARAQETAAIIAGQLGQRDCLETWAELAPGGTTDTVCHRICRLEEKRSVMLVGHEPLLSALVSRIISGQENAAIAMPKGAVAKIRNLSCLQGPAGELHWLMTANNMSGPL
jgi:phosphohistidine phosphatase